MDYDYTVTCPACGARVRHPRVRLTPNGMIDICDQCGAPLTDEIGLLGAGDFGVVVKPTEQDHTNV